MSRIYLAGPMSNIPYFNFPAFFEAADKLKTDGHEVFNPAQSDVDNYGDFWKNCPKGSMDEIKVRNGGAVPNYREFLRVDLNWILDNAEAIAFLPGWEKSKGVKAEKALAECLQLKEIYL